MGYTELAERKRAEAVTGMRAILDLAAEEERDLTPDEVSRIEQMEADADKLGKEAKRSARADELAKEAAGFRGLPAAVHVAAESHVDPAVEAPLTTRLYGTADSVDLRSLLTSTSSNALATTKYWGSFEEYLANNSAAVQSGVRMIDIDATTLHVPAGTALATGAWLAEGGTAVASDMGVEGQTVTPARLTVFSEFSNEVLEDASFPIVEAINQSMFASLGQLLDAAVFEGTGAGNEPQGMLDLAGSSTATSGGSAVDLGYFVEMAENGLTANKPVTAWATNPAAWGAYADIKRGGSADLTPLLQTDSNRGGAAIAGSVLGKPLYVTGNIDSLGAGTAAMFGFDPEDVWVVRRRDFRLIKDPFTKAEQGLTRFVLEGRFGVHFPRPGAIQVATVLTP